MDRTRIALIITGLALAAVSGIMAQDTGSADFTKYVALGDSLTAGVTNAGLSDRQQRNSFPALLHGQSGAPGPFEQPFVSEPGIPTQVGLLGLVPPTLALKEGICDGGPNDCNICVPGADCLGGGVCEPLPFQGLPLNLTLPRPYDNLGVPGATLHELVSVRTDFGGAFDLVLRGLDCGIVPTRGGIPCTAAEQAVSLSPTFVTLWAGNNEILGPATCGILCDEGDAGCDPELPVGCLNDFLPSQATFRSDLEGLVASLTAAGADLALGNVVDVEAAPRFNTLPYFLTDATGAPVLNNGQVIPLIGTTGEGTIRPLTAEDRLMLSWSAPVFGTVPTSVLIAAGCGVPGLPGAPLAKGDGSPLCPSGALPNGVILDVDELARIATKTAELNDIIESVATAAGAALFDARALFAQIHEEGLALGGIEYTTEFLTGGLFGYDGVHPTALGYGVVANGFIEAINETYGASIELVDLSPFVFGDAAPCGTVVLPPGLGGGVHETVESANSLFRSLGLIPLAQTIDINDDRPRRKHPRTKPGRSTE